MTPTHVTFPASLGASDPSPYDQPTSPPTPAPAADGDAAELIARLKPKYPGRRLAAVRTTAGLVVFRSPSHAEYQAYRKQITADDTRHVAMTTLFITTGVHPEFTQLRGWLDEYPGIANNARVIAVMRQLSGEADEDFAKI